MDVITYVRPNLEVVSFLCWEKGIRKAIFNELIKL